MMILLPLLLLPSGFEGLTFILISFAYRLDFISIFPADHYEAYPLWAHSGQRCRGFGAVPSTRPLLIFSDDRRGLPVPFRSFGGRRMGSNFCIDKTVPRCWNDVRGELMRNRKNFVVLSISTAESTASGVAFVVQWHLPLCISIHHSVVCMLSLSNSNQTKKRELLELELEFAKSLLCFFCYQIWTRRTWCVVFFVVVSPSARCKIDGLDGRAGQVYVFLLLAVWSGSACASGCVLPNGTL